MDWSCKKKRWKPAKSVSFFVAWNGGRGRKNKDENGNVLAGQVGVEVASWRETVGLVRKEERRKVVGRLAPEGRLLAAAVFLKCPLPAAFCCRRNPAYWIYKKIRKETKICLVRFVVMVFQLLMGMR